MTFDIYGNVKVIGYQHFWDPTTQNGEGITEHTPSTSKNSSALDDPSLVKTSDP